MIQLEFSKERAQEIMRCIKNKKPLPVVQNWNDLMMIVGVGQMIFAGDLIELKFKESGKLPKEKMEHMVLQTFAEVRGAVRSFEDFTHAVFSGDYDNRFDPVVKGVMVEEDGHWAFAVQEGAKLPQE